MIATPKVKFEENICELLLKTSTRARKKRTMRAFAPPHAAPAATAATGPVSSNTRRRLYRLGRPASGRESKDPFTSDRVRRPSAASAEEESVRCLRRCFSKVSVEERKQCRFGSSSSSLSSRPSPTPPPSRRGTTTYKIIP